MGLRLRPFLGILVTATMAVACAGAPAEDDVDDGTGAQVAEMPDAIGTIEGDAQTATRIARIGAFRYALDGARVSELAIGRRYSLTMMRTRAPQRDGLDVRQLVSYRAVKHVVGTLADDANDPNGMILTSLHGKSYALYGDTVATYKEIRASLPAHDYAKTLFEANVVEDKSPATRFSWLDYQPVPHVRCTQKDAPSVHLDLVDVKPDLSLLDGFVTTPIGGTEVRVGAHAECKRDQTGVYACALDSVGEPWGTAKVTPSDSASFDAVVERTDATKIPFACTVVKREAVATASED